MFQYRVNEHLCWRMGTRKHEAQFGSPRREVAAYLFVQNLGWVGLCHIGWLWNQYPSPHQSSAIGSISYFERRITKSSFCVNGIFPPLKCLSELESIASVYWQTRRDVNFAKIANRDIYALV
jgi:hypothetical protein